ncbi:MAG: Inner membrane protein CreD [uncultured Thiotrichaceae bacterium]|uniref:Inner membrane protein CreD n=1 Tax=uncultured Thiotrichaceae bacterium TaxID=298394 RepID=A0A6S6SSV3_9GAMM|nr:MAG: Inner membrane protein CreD [uncultured Thiotrichaceae bacterium]
MNETATDRWRFVTSSLTLHTLIIGLMILLMLIPLFMVGGVVNERSHYQQQVIQDVAADWGGKQTLTGPFLVIPYVEHLTSVDTVTDDKGKNQVVTKDIFNDHTLILLPETLDIRAKIDEERRKRGIYDALVYNAKLDVTAAFDHEFLLDSGDGDRRILWDKVFLMVGLSDTKAINSGATVEWDGDSVSLQPGTGLPDVIAQGFHVPLDEATSNDTKHDFKLELELQGSDGLFFAPLGKTTTTVMTSGWQHPSFQGDLLPKSHDIDKDGFKARWDIPNLARSYPQHWWLEDKAKYDPGYFTAGVSLYEPVSLYSQVERAVKYGILFIALTFLTFFAFEIASGARLHILQYGLIGFALALFYLILMALAEHLPFRESYIAAASSVVIMIWIYAWAVLRSFWKGLFILLMLGGLYYLLFMILQMEDYALLAGTGLLVFATLMMMFVTRNSRFS